jgi:hypothetical protein
VERPAARELWVEIEASDRRRGPYLLLVNPIGVEFVPSE